jgi:hypothetical protein
VAVLRLEYPTVVLSNLWHEAHHRHHQLSVDDTGTSRVDASASACIRSQARPYTVCQHEVTVRCERAHTTLAHPAVLALPSSVGAPLAPASSPPPRIPSPNAADAEAGLAPVAAANVRAVATTSLGLTLAAEEGRGDGAALPRRAVLPRAFNVTR